MPESRVRKEAAKKKEFRKKREEYKHHQDEVRLAAGGRDWVPWAFIPVGLLGVLWLIVWNLAGQSIGFMAAIGNWNLLVALAFIIVSFGLMTLWK